MGLREHLKQSPAFEVWRRAREFQQHRQFDRILDESFIGKAHSGRYSESNTKLLIQQTALKRRPLMGSSGKPRIIGFGTHGWEDHGLWPSFSRLFDFHLFDYVPVVRNGPSEPTALAEVITQSFDNFLNKLEQLEPVNAVFFYASGAYIPSILLQRLHQKGIWSVVMGLDDKHQFIRPVDDDGIPHQLRVARTCDLYWTTWRTGTQRILDEGGSPWYGPEAADPAFHRPLYIERDLQIVFVGQSYGSRRQLINYLRERGLSVTTRGYGWPEGSATFDETIQLFNRAQIVLGIGGVGHMSGVKHLKGRDFEVPMCGAAYLTTFNPELTDFFHIGEEILCYSSKEECAEMAQWLLLQRDQLETVRSNALRKSLLRHSWEQRLSDLFRLWS